VLIIDNSGNVNGLIASLESPTEASRTLGFIASRDVAWIAGDRGNGNVNGDYAEGYALSPHGDRIAAIQVDEFDRPKRLIVLDVGGSGVQEIALPSGVKSAFVRSWSPDESAILVSGCRPCNKAQSPSEHQTAEHSHLYIVPLDGSPWRELLDVNNEYLDATWSPDGSTLAVTHGACVAGTHMPRCPPGYSTLSLLNLQDETERPITAPTESAEWAAWSPDGRRIAFIGGKAGEILKDGGVFVVDADGTGPIKLADTNSSTPTVWSPDGQWLLYQKNWTEWWVVSVNGGQPRLFGAYGGVTW
jgi:WD40 repeat protein